VQFHRLPSRSVPTKVNRFRKKVDDLPVEEMELFCHSEPFDVACRLANCSLDVEKHLAHYLKIRDVDDENGFHREIHPRQKK